MLSKTWRTHTSPDAHRYGPGLSYELRSFVVDRDYASLEPRDFIIKAEQFGVPQARHRVIILGIRTDANLPVAAKTLSEVPQVSVGEVIGDLPRIRSGLSPRSRIRW